MRADDFISINKATIRKLLKQVFNNDTLDKRGILKETKAVLLNALSKGFGKNLNEIAFNTPDYILLNNLSYNVGVFAAFKNHSFIGEITKLLRDEKGKLRNWTDFKKEALKLDEKYNKTWLKVEYDQAVTSARAAKRWNDIQRTKDIYPNLEYRTVGDARVRELHKKWHGIILPVDHVFWKTHYTPNDYDCRCNVRRTTKAVETKGFDVENMPKLPPQFNQNVGITGKVYNENHPYYKTKDYKKVADFAHRALINFQIREINRHLKKTKATKRLYKSQLGAIKLNSKGVKRILSNPHKDAWLKNNLMYNISGMFKDALYVKSANSVKSNPMVKTYHYFLVKVDNKSFYLNVREMINGDLSLYTITDKLK